MSGPVVVIGAGAVGLGVLVPQLQARGAAVAVVARTADQARAVARAGVPSIAIDDRRELIELVGSAGLLVVAVRPPDLVRLAPRLTPALERRRSPVDVLVCDNRRAAARWFRACVAEHGDRALAHTYATVLVDHIAVRIPSSSGWRVLAEAHGTLEVDGGALPDGHGRVLSDLGLTPVSDFSARAARKLHVFSCGHVAAAYLGRARGHATMASALSDVTVADGVRAAMVEGQRGIAACFGRGFAGGEVLRERCVARYAQPRIPDTTERVGRDPARKLRAGDRIVGPARLSAALGLASPALAQVAAAALLATRSDDRVGELLRRAGAEAALSQLSGLPRDHGFVLATGRAYAGLVGSPDPLPRRSEAPDPARGGTSP